MLGITREVTFRLAAAPQGSPAGDKQLVPGPDIRTHIAGQLVRGLHPGGGVLHGGAIFLAAVHPAGNGATYLLPGLGINVSSCNVDHPVHVYKVGVPAIKVSYNNTS